MPVVRKIIEFLNAVSWKLQDLGRLPIYFLSYWFPKSNEIWIFGEQGGYGYGDNPRALYEYIINNHPEIRPIWLTRSEDILQEIECKGGKVFHMTSLPGYFWAMRAKVAVFCVEVPSDLLYFTISSKTICVNTWHGTPLKKIGNDINKGIFAKQTRISSWGKILKLGRAMWPVPLRKTKDYFVSSSENVSVNLMSAFLIDESKILLTGYPRNDLTMASISEKNLGGRKKIVYMPTFRNHVGTEIDLFTTYGFDVKMVEQFLEEHDAELWLRLHRYNRPTGEVLEMVKRSERIKFDLSKSVYYHLGSYDLLVTDYSSIYFDYLLLGRPIVFSPFDHEQYLTKDRELYYDYNQVTPGPKACTWPEVIGLIEQFLVEPDLYHDERMRICKIFNQFVDSNNSERLFAGIRQIIADS